MRIIRSEQPFPSGERTKDGLVLLSALPQLPHYLLDGCLWRRKGNCAALP